MKRFISAVLVAVMIVSMFAINASAAGTLIHSDSFDNGFALKNWITDRANCLFEWDKYNKCIEGFDAAVVLQSNFNKKYDRWWAQYYTEFDFQVRAYDDYLPEHEGRAHSISLWYNDLMERGESAGDVSQRGANYMYTIDIGTGKATLTKKYEWSYYDENNAKQEASMNEVIAEGQIEGTIEVGEDAPWYNFGMRVSEGKIECYFNQKLVLSSSAADGKENLGDTFLDAVDPTVGSEKSAILLFNDGNWLAIDNFEVWTPDYDFSAAPEVIYGDVNTDGSVNLVDVSTMLQAIAGWTLEKYDEAAADVTADNAVNLADVTRMLQSIAGWNVVLGPAE